MWGKFGNTYIEQVNSHCWYISTSQPSALQGGDVTLLLGQNFVKYCTESYEELTPLTPRIQGFWIFKVFTTPDKGQQLKDQKAH